MVTSRCTLCVECHAILKPNNTSQGRALFVNNMGYAHVIYRYTPPRGAF